MPVPIIEIENMSYTYPDGTRALKNLNMKILEGKRTAIIGSNGAGKSTLFPHLNGLQKPTSGLIKLDDEPINYQKEELIKSDRKWVWSFKTRMINSSHL